MDSFWDGVFDFHCCFLKTCQQHHHRNYTFGESKRCSCIAVPEYFDVVLSLHPGVGTVVKMHGTLIP